HLIVIIPITQIVPALRPHHHLARRTLLIDPLRHRRPLRLRDPIVDRERRLPVPRRSDLSPQLLAYPLHRRQRHLVRDNRLRRRSTSSFAISSSTTARCPSTAFNFASSPATSFGSATSSSRSRFASTSCVCSTINFSRSGCIVITSRRRCRSRFTQTAESLNL